MDKKLTVIELRAAKAKLNEDLATAIKALLSDFQEKYGVGIDISAVRLSRYHIVESEFETVCGVQVETEISVF